MSIEQFQNKLNILTRRWWFYLIIFLIFLIPPYVSKGYQGTDRVTMGIDMLSKSLRPYTSFQPIFHIIPVILIITLFFLKNKVNRIFSIYIAINYLLMAFIWNITVLDKYGLVISVANLILYFFVFLFWSWEAAFGENVVSFQKPKPWKYLFIPLAILAFWFPINSITLRPDFNPIYLLTSDSGLAFCSMTPVYLTVFLFMYSRINKVVIRLTSFIGLIIGILAIVLAASNIWHLWWVGVTHLPLFIISLTCFVISLRKYS
jgi:hypothetical protein